MRKKEVTARCYACGNYSEEAICLACKALNVHLGRVQIEPYEYAFKPPAHRLATPREISLGVELEFESSSRYSCGEITSALNADFPFIYIKRDGSLNSKHAGEIVSVPASLRVHKYMWSTYFFNGGSAYKRFLIDVRSRSCGFHVHVGREQLSSSQIIKMFAFLNYHHNESFVYAVAGRKSFDYASIVGYGKYTYGAYWCRVHKCHGGQRRVALNLCPKGTVEIRIFKATLSPFRFFARLEFVHALAMACAPGNGLRNCINYENFVNWVASRKEDYPYLCKYLASKNLLVN